MPLIMEQVAGLEPALNAWQALVLTTDTIPAYNSLRLQSELNLLKTAGA